MTGITINGLKPAMAAALGDAALRGGDPRLASMFYRQLVNQAPQSPQARARLGLCRRPNKRTLPMLGVIQALEALPDTQIYVGEGIATWMKDPGFMDDPKFLELTDRHAAIAPSGVSNWHWNLQVMLWAAEQASDLPGDFVELGVYKGHTTLFLAEYLNFAASPRRWWLFDTFEGIPVDQRDVGREGLTAEAYGEAFSVEEVRERFRPFPNIQVIKGRVPEVFADACPDRISFLHIDLNSSTAEIAALDALYERLSPGGVIIFDDFGWSTSAAQRKAETAWFRDRGLTILGLPTGQGLFVKPPAP